MNQLNYSHHQHKLAILLLTKFVELEEDSLERFLKRKQNMKFKYGMYSKKIKEQKLLSYLCSLQAVELLNWFVH